MCTSRNDEDHSLGTSQSNVNVNVTRANCFISQSKQRVLNGPHGSEVFRARKVSPTPTNIAPFHQNESFTSASERDESVIPEWMRVEKSEHDMSSVFSPEDLLHPEKQLPSAFEPTREHFTSSAIRSQC